MPRSTPPLGTVSETANSGGEANGTADADAMGRSEAPDARGRMEPSATNATRLRPLSWSCGVMWGHVGSCGATWYEGEALELVTWGHVGSRGVMWGHVVRG